MNINRDSSRENLTIKGKRYTKDIGLAAYLKMKGHELEIKKQGKRGLFYYEEKLKPEIDRYFEDTDKFLTFSINMRNLKSQVFNTMDEVKEG